MTNQELFKVFLEAKNKINIKENEQIILNSRLPVFCYLFAVNIPESNKQELSRVVLQSLNNEFITLFYENVDFDKSEYDKYLLFI